MSRKIPKIWALSDSSCVSMMYPHSNFLSNLAFLAFTSGFFGRLFSKPKKLFLFWNKHEIPLKLGKYSMWNEQETPENLGFEFGRYVT